MVRALFVFIALLLTTTASAAPVNLVINGDFSGGNVGFGSDYLFVADSPAGDDLWDPGIYGIDGSASGRHPYWSLTGDRTGSGQMMLVNGFTTGPSSVWRQSVAVTPGTNYFFEAWAMDLCCNADMPVSYTPPSLSFWINGFMVGSSMTGATGVWSGLSNIWHSAGASLATLEVRNASTVYSGNDFAIDDIFLGTETSIDPIPEPASMLLLGTGLIGVARSVRRKRG